jgi:hypothetical protein
MRAFVLLFSMLLGTGCPEEHGGLDDDEVAYLQFVARFADRVCVEAARCEPDNAEYFCDLGYDDVEQHCARFDALAASDCLAGRWYCDPYITWPNSCIDVCEGNELGFGYE